MEIREAINEFIKIFYISLISYLTLFKITNYKNNDKKKRAIIFLECIFVAIVYVILIDFLYPIGAFIISFLIFGIGIRNLFKDLNSNFITSYLMSIVITYTIYLISIVIAGLILKLLIPTISSRSYLGLLTIIIVQTIFMLVVSRTKRLKGGLNFLKKRKINKNILIFTLLFSGLTLIVFGLFQRTNTEELNTLLFAGSILIIISLIIWTQNQITKQYKRNMRDRTIEIQTKEIVEQSKIIKEIKEENLKLAETIHKYNNRLSALELGIANALKTNNKTEFANELGLMLEETKELSKNFAEETTINKTNLPKTNIIGLDNMFKYFQNEANKNNIDFNVIINENIEDLLKIIDKPKLETLIGDHLKDAIIAVNKSKNPYKSILVILGISNKGYEISICDSGIEFEIDTLLKLGKERVTTHKEEGGSGIGFITTFKTLKETKASLEIEEYNPKTTNYTKSIVIRFDGKNEYRIYSYRAEEIKKKNNEKRIIIEEL